MYSLPPYDISLYYFPIWMKASAKFLNIMKFSILKRNKILYSLRILKFILSFAFAQEAMWFHQL